MDATAGLELRQIAECMRILSVTDGRLKGAFDAYSPMDSLERMVLEMCDVVTA